MTKKAAAEKTAAPRKAPKNMVVSEKSIKSSAARVIDQGSLVSAEIMYVINQLGRSATQDEIDATVVAVRKMKWADLMAGLE